MVQRSACSKMPCPGGLTYDLAARRDGDEVACDQCGFVHIWYMQLEVWVRTTKVWTKAR
jgi:hypothetical protein